MCPGWRNANDVKKANGMHLRRWPGKPKIQIHAEGHYVQTPATYWHADVSGAYDAPVHSVARVFQRRTDRIELLTAVNAQRVRHILEHGNRWVLFVNVV